jgi:fatty-acyl-CoA synthase
VLVCPTNAPDVLASFLALFYLGAVPLSVSGVQMGQAPGSQLDFIREILLRTGAKGVFTQPELVGGAADEELTLPAQLIDFTPGSLAMDSEPPGIEPAVLDPDDLAFVQFSSGSLSRPKGVQITHRNVIENLRLLVESGRRHPDETGATWVPLYHDMGLIGTMFASLWHCPRRWTIFNPIRFLMRPLSWLAELSRHGGRISVCPNFALDLCIDRIREEDLAEQQIDLSALDMLFVSAEPVKPTTLRRFQERFRAYGLRERVLYPVYGMAETTLIVTSPHYQEEIVTRTVDGIEVPSVGRPLGNYALRILAEDGTPVPAGAIGEIQLRGTCVTPGYLDEEANAAHFSDGWLRTGDLGTVDEQGRLYITGRSKDLIIVNGRNYYAHDIVAELEELPFFERGKVAVFPVQYEGAEHVVVMTVPASRVTPTMRAKIAAFQGFMKVGGPRGWLKGVGIEQLEGWVDELISSDRAALINEVKRYVLARFGVPLHDVVFVPRIPRTTSGKLKRDAIVQLYHEHASGSAKDE